MRSAWTMVYYVFLRLIVSSTLILVVINMPIGHASLETHPIDTPHHWPNHQQLSFWQKTTLIVFGINHHLFTLFFWGMSYVVAPWQFCTTYVTAICHSCGSHKTVHKSLFLLYHEFSQLRWVSKQTDAPIAKNEEVIVQKYFCEKRVFYFTFALRVW